MTRPRGRSAERRHVANDKHNHWQTAGVESHGTGIEARMVEHGHQHVTDDAPVPDSRIREREAQ